MSGRTGAAAIDVREAGGGLHYDVVVRGAGSATRHQVAMPAADFARLAAGGATSAQVIEAAFRFLLDREPKESILSRFDIAVIARYFPEFERELPNYLAK